MKKDIVIPAATAKELTKVYFDKEIDRLLLLIAKEILKAAKQGKNYCKICIFTPYLKTITKNLEDLGYKVEEEFDSLRLQRDIYIEW